VEPCDASGSDEAIHLFQATLAEHPDHLEALGLGIAQLTQALRILDGASPSAPPRASSRA
jgi:hypothetical protein